VALNAPRRRLRPALCTALLSLCLLPGWGSAQAPPLSPGEHAFDPAQSRFGFEIRTRFGQRIEGIDAYFALHINSPRLAGRSYVRFTSTGTGRRINISLRAWFTPELGRCYPH